MDRVKKNQELKELIKEKAYVENPQNKPITDGPIDPNRFLQPANQEPCSFLKNLMETTAAGICQNLLMLKVL